MEAGQWAGSGGGRGQSRREVSLRLSSSCKAVASLFVQESPGSDLYAGNTQASFVCGCCNFRLGQPLQLPPPQETGGCLEDAL